MNILFANYVFLLPCFLIIIVLRGYSVERLTVKRWNFVALSYGVYFYPWSVERVIVCR